MSKLPNHYETLNISNSASAEEVKASYNILCKMFGADQDMAAELNNAYMVLKDANTRAAYDRQILESMNKKASRSELPVGLPSLPKLPTEAPKKKTLTAKVINIDEAISLNIRQRQSLKELNNDWSSKLAAIACTIAIVASLFHSIITHKDTLSRLSFLNIQDFMSTGYTRPALAPNGQPYPETSSYLSGFEIQNNQGGSSLNVINSKNDNDVYLKLLAHDGKKVAIVRHVYVKGNSSFNIENLSPGTYEIQYLDLVAGQGGRSEIFNVTESKTAMGSEVSRLSVTLRTAVDGVLKVEKVSIEEFNSLATL